MRLLVTACSRRGGQDARPAAVPAKLIVAMSKVRPTTVPAAGFAAVLRGREFRLLWLADAQSLLGDQLARVALSVLVYDRTGSGLVTAVVYALTYLPALFGGVLLGPLADRLPRRGLLVGGDVVRAALLAVMTVPRLPVPFLAGLLVLVVLVGTPCKAGETALVVDLLATADYPMGLGLRAATVQAAQLAGFAVGGVAVAALGARGALGLDAATFLLSAVLIRLGVHARPAAARTDNTDARGSHRWLHGAVTVLRDRRLRLLLGLSWLLGLLVIPEGLAAPYAHGLGGGPRTVGLLLAGGPAGVLLGTLVYSRFLSASTRARLLGPLAAAAGLPLLACAGTPGLTATYLLWGLSGTCTAYQVQVVTEFVEIIAPRVRGQPLGQRGAQCGGAVGARTRRRAGPESAHVRPVRTHRRRHRDLHGSDPLPAFLICDRHRPFHCNITVAGGRSHHTTDLECVDPQTS